MRIRRKRYLAQNNSAVTISTMYYNSYKRDFKKEKKTMNNFQSRDWTRFRLCSVDDIIQTAFLPFQADADILNVRTRIWFVFYE